MKKQWFEPMVHKWNTAAAWTRPQVNQICRQLAEISALYGGTVIWDCPEDKDAARWHALEQARLALQAHMTRTANRLSVRPSTRYYSEATPDFSAAYDFLTPSRYVPAIDLNEAMADDLVPLPGLGPVTAQRIMAHRQEVGRFASPEDVKSLKGIGKVAYEKFESAVYVTQKAPRLFIFNPAEAAFVKRPSFANFVQMLNSGSRIASHAQANGNQSVAHLVQAELQSLRDELAAHPATKRKQLGQLGSNVLANMARLQSGEQLANRASGNGSGTIVASSLYRPFVEQLLSQVQQRIWLAMFFYRHEDDPKYPVYSMTEALVDCHRRGCDVRVVLDHDAEEEKYGSHDINRAAYEYLSQCGLPVRYNATERRLHAKLLIVDGRYLLLGSHNWTAGSLYQYDDKSVFIESEALATHYQAWYQQLWQDC